MKALLKSTAAALATFLVAPLLVTHAICGRTGSADSSLETHGQCLALVPGKVGSYLRVAFYRRTLRYCDPTATIAFGALLSKVDAEIHKHVYIGPRCMLGLVTLEEDVLLGPAVQIPSGSKFHGIDDLATPIRLQNGEVQRVTVGTDSWIGAASIVLADVKEHTVVGAGSVVTKSHHAASVIVGNPARLIRSRSQAEVQSESPHDRE